MHHIEQVGLIFPRVMSNLRWPMTNLRNGSSSGKQSHLPPKGPCLGMLHSYADYLGRASIGSRSNPRVGEAHRAHQRTSSESFFIEVQPSWLDDLLNEPEIPIRRGSHRRSSSDSVAYLDASKNISNLSSLAQEGLNGGNLSSVPSWWSADFEHIGDFQGASYCSEVSSVERQVSKTWDLSSSSRSNASGLPSGKDNLTHRHAISNVSPEQDAYPSTSAGKQDQVEGGLCDPKGSSYDKRDVQNAKPSAEADTKRSKQ